MIKTTYVQLCDKAFWFSLDRHLSESEFDNKVKGKMGYVIWNDDTPVGVLRYNLFWDSIPFCNLIYIDDRFQQNGYGRSLMERWENDMKALGYGIVMTSTQSDEQAQHFYRKLGYRETGSLIFDIAGYQQPMELVFVKDIR